MCSPPSRKLDARKDGIVDAVLAHAKRAGLIDAAINVTLGRFDIGRTRAATRRPMSPLRSTASNRRLIDMA